MPALSEAGGAFYRDVTPGRYHISVDSYYSHLTEAERLKKAYELIGLIEEIKRGPEMPPPLEYRPEENGEEPPPSGIGGRLTRL